MAEARERYLTDHEGRKVAVVLDLEDYERLLDAQDELDAIHSFDAAEASGERPVAFEEAVKRIERTGR
jgi:hypothetical protein